MNKDNNNDKPLREKIKGGGRKGKSKGKETRIKTKGVKVDYGAPQWDRERRWVRSE